MTKMAPDFSFRKEHFLCLKCNEKNIHQCRALECGYSQLINHNPLSICWSQSLTERGPCPSRIYSVPTFPHSPRPHRQLPPRPPGPKHSPPYSVAAHSLSRVWLCRSRTVAHQAPPSLSVSWSLLRFVSTELAIPCNHLILCHPFSFCFQSFPASGLFQWIDSSHQVT